jgi:hypothetical protein
MFVSFIKKSDTDVELTKASPINSETFLRFVLMVNEYVWYHIFA